MRRVFHITFGRRWREAKSSGTYLPEGFRDDGFIHCSYAVQVLHVANALYRGKTGLVLLEIDASLVGCEVIDEKTEGGREFFPHIYGPLPCSTVSAVHLLPCGQDGLFQLPEGISISHVESTD